MIQINEIDEKFNKDFIRDINNEILRFNDLIISKRFLKLIESNHKNVFLSFEGAIFPIIYFNNGSFPHKNGGREDWHYMKIYDMNKDAYYTIDDIIGIITYRDDGHYVLPFLTLFSFLTNSVNGLIDSRKIDRFNNIDDRVKVSLDFLKDLNLSFKFKDRIMCQNLFGIKNKDLLFFYIKDSIYVKAKFELTASYKYLLKILRWNDLRYRTCKNKNLRFPPA